MQVPDWWSFLILALAGFRWWRLLAEDTIFDGPRHLLVGLPWHYKDGDPIPQDYHYDLAKFLTCPWCLGFWIALALWGMWELTPFWTEVFSIPMALSAALGLIRVRLDPPDEETERPAAG